MRLRVQALIGDGLDEVPALEWCLDFEDGTVRPCPASGGVGFPRDFKEWLAEIFLSERTDEQSLPGYKVVMEVIE